MTSSELARVSEEATTTCEKEDGVGNSVHVFAQAKQILNGPFTELSQT